MNGYARFAVLAVTVIVVAVGGWYLLGPPRGGVGGPATSPSPTVTESASASTSPAPLPVTFSSPLYGYTITPPAGWSATPATKVWDGKGAPGNEDPAVDKFHGPGMKTMHVFAASSSLELAAYGNDIIARTAQFHHECPPDPESVESTSVGEDSAKFISWNCGILINLVVALHGDKGYQFLFRDPIIHQATNATDRATFESMLDSVSFSP